MVVVMFLERVGQAARFGRQAGVGLYHGSEIHPQANPEFVGSFQVAPIHPKR
jgi:hypothetical protein